MPDHIVIGDIRPRVQYTADGTQAVFTYPFPIFAAADLKVYLGEALQAAGFSVAGAGQSAGGSVTFAAPPAAGTRVTLVRALAIARTSDFQEGGAFRAKTLNDELDRQTAFVQEVGERIERAIVAAPTESAAPLVLPPPAERANALLGFDAAGAPIASAGAGSVAISPALAPVVQAASIGAAKDLLGVAHKNAVVDFGAVGDDATNNDAAAAAIVAWLNTNGGFVYWPRGIYRFNTPLPTITSKGGGFIGAGPGMRYHDQNAGPGAGGVYGTVFRRNFATQDLITIGAGNDSGNSAQAFVVRDIGFWPVPFTTDGYEIHDRGNDTLIENVHGVYTNGFIKAGGGANASTYRQLRAVGIWGDAAILVRGTGNSPAQWAQGIVIDNFEQYQPSLTTIVYAQWKGAWATSTLYAQNDLITANGRIWEATNGGTSASAGSGPVTPAYSFAGAPTTVYVNDNGILWRMLGKQNGSAVLIDSNSVVVSVINSLLVGTMQFGVNIQNTLASPIMPIEVNVINTLIDHILQNGVNVGAGWLVTLNTVLIHWSIIGRGVEVQNGFLGNLTIEGGHIYGSGLDGILLNKTGAMIASIAGMKVQGNGVATANTYSGILTGASLEKYSITGCDLGVDPGGGGTQKYGIDQGAGNNNYTIKGNIALGNGTGGYNLVSGRDVTTRIVQGNVGAQATFTADQEGSWSPVLTFDTPGNLNVAYAHQVGRYIVKDGWIFTEFSIQTSTFTHTTASGNLRITGLPVSHVNVTGLITGGALAEFGGITKANYTQFSAWLLGATNIINIRASGQGQAPATVVTGDCPTGGAITLRGVLVFKVA
jgi:hypothetical protein